MILYFQIFFTTLAVSFGILHLILFFYNRQLKSNLFFAIFLFLYALNIFFDYQASLASDYETALLYLRFHRAVMPYNPLFALLFFYSAFNLKIPKHFWIIVFVFVVTGFLAVLEPVSNFEYIQVAQVLILIESLRVFNLIFKLKKPDAWLIAAGFSLLFLFSMYDLFMDLNFIDPIYDINNGYPFGFVCLMICSSVYLAKNFARANKSILEHELKAKEDEISRIILEEEDRRKTIELEEARALQLSMLPQCNSELNGYNICFDMRPASEVGGDYYDYHIADDGTMTLAIGDATDHGMRAGMMVAIIKSLFLTHISNTDIISFFNKCTQTIKQMKFTKLYMALMILKIKGTKITASSAGMPKILIHRCKTNFVDEYTIKGMPLGAFDEFPYQTIEIDIEPGDTVLLMSDGLAELFNDSHELFDYQRIKGTLKANASLSANRIVNKLFEAGDNWRMGNPQNDDITFIVFKYMGNNKST